MKRIGLFLIILFYNSLNAQDSSQLKISLLTCGSGQELYALFGHSALRVIDNKYATDIVYNYGTFPFEENGFYLKFIKGKLKYYVDASAYQDFLAEYKYENRSVIEQELKLSAEEKKSIQRFLNNNVKEENKYYQYDFFFDNCTTRIRDIIAKHSQSQFLNTNTMPTGTTFRQAIHFYLNKNNQPWSKLGIDILLGLPCDAKMTSKQMQFLPNNLMQSLEISKPLLVLPEKKILADSLITNTTWLTPACLFTGLLLLLIFISLLKVSFIQYFLKGFDIFLFFSTGLLGFILVLMWTQTNHAMCKYNFNLLWAFPTHLFIVFFINSKRNWVKKYFGFTAICMLILMLIWFILPQDLNIALMPIVLLLICRSTAKYRSFR